MKLSLLVELFASDLNFLFLSVLRRDRVIDVTTSLWVAMDKFVDPFKAARLGGDASLNVTQKEMRCHYTGILTGEIATATVGLRPQVLYTSN